MEQEEIVNKRPEFTVKRRESAQLPICFRSRDTRRNNKTMVFEK